MNLQESIRKDLNLLEAPIEMTNDPNLDKIEKYREIICKANMDLNTIWEDELNIPGLDYEELDDAIKILGEICENMEIAMNHGLTEAPLELIHNNQKISYEMVESQETIIDYVYTLDEEETEEWIKELGYTPEADDILNHMLNFADGHRDDEEYRESKYKITMFLDGNKVEEYNL